MDDDVILREYLFKEVDIIQGIINRMAFNSFLIKGWAVTLIVVTFLVKGNTYHVLIAFFPLVLFWYLDAYFLWQEQMYRQLYKWVISNRMQTKAFILDMNAYRFKENVDSIPRIMHSFTLYLFYCTITILIIIYLLIQYLIIEGVI